MYPFLYKKKNNVGGLGLKITYIISSQHLQLFMVMPISNVATIGNV